MTGRAAGYCSGADAPGWAGRGSGSGADAPGWAGRGSGRGLGRLGMRGGWGVGWMGAGGRGRRRRLWFAGSGPGWFGIGPAIAAGARLWGYRGGPAAPTSQEESAALGERAEWLKRQLEAVSRRIEELGSAE
jgi:hypothetical protein